MYHRRRGFTLIEILVVLGIVAALIAVLMPVVGVISRQVDSTTCANAIRQIGLAMTAYVVDNEQCVPVFRENRAATSYLPVHWFEKLARYADVNDSRNLEAIRDGNASLIWGCPMWERDPSAAACYPGYGINIRPLEPGNWTGHYCIGTSYYDDNGLGANSCQQGVLCGKPQRIRMSAITKQDQRIAIGDSKDWHMAGWAWDDRTPFLDPTRHRNGANYMRWDNSLVKLTTAAQADEMLDLGP
jgi:prepilin-type N-terminal cleavage/methylation domain-containing protein